MAKIICSVCEKESNIRPAKVKDKNYCSHACYWESLRTSIMKQCFVCQKQISVKPGYLQEKNFCSIKCRSAHFTGENHQNYKKIPDKFCDTCGNQVRHEIATRERVKHCSSSCAHKGPKSRSWKGGISPYTTDFEKRIRYEVRERDGEQCTKCGKSPDTPKGLHVHHIDHNKKNNKKSNLITLCVKCHRSEHKAKSLKRRDLLQSYQ